MFSQLFGRSPAGGAPRPETFAPDDFARLAEREGLLIVDVREDGEWRSGHVPGAMHAPLSRFAEAARKLPHDRPWLLYCLSGGRSTTAMAEAARLGIAVRGHLGGGIGAWRRAGLPVVHGA